MIWGAGGHAKVVADVARDQTWEVVGCIDRDDIKETSPSSRYTLPLAATEAELKALLRRGDPLPEGAVAVALGIGDNAIRSACAAALGPLLAPPIIHSRATVSMSAMIGDGSVIFAGAVVNADAKIGRSAIINSGAVIEHDCTIADGAHVSPGGVLAGRVSVGALSWVGAGAVVLPGVSIGARAIVGAGAVVTRDVADDATVIGNPAAVIKRR